MVMGTTPLPDWRNQPGIISMPHYKRKFAFFPVFHSHGIIWLKTYYKHYRMHTSSVSSGDLWDNEHVHIDFIANITEAEYIVRKLSESL